MNEFNYPLAFERNLGWLNEEDQLRLKGSCVAIAGVGGVGGFQAQALARLGVGRFKIADPDIFEITNINRQLGATTASLGRPKVQVIEEMIRAINPEAEVHSFPEAFTVKTADAFLEGANLVIDGIDYFAMEDKLFLYKKSYEMGIPALTSCPMGFGASVIIFSPRGMRFDQYFDLKEGMSLEEKMLAVTFGLSPTPLCLSYLSPKSIDLADKRASSVVPGLMLAGAFTGTEAVKILAQKGKAHYCPHIYQIDLMSQKVSKKFYPNGMRGPLIRLKKWAVINVLKAQKRLK